MTTDLTPPDLTPLEPGDATGAIDPLEITGIRDYVHVKRERSPRAMALAAVAFLVAAGAVALGALDTTAEVGPGQVLSAALVVAWSLAAAFVLTRKPDEPLGVLLLGGAALGALALLGSVLLGRDLSSSSADLASAARALGMCLVPAVATHVALGLPDGRLRTRARRVLTGLMYAAGIGVAVVVYGDRPEFPGGGLAGLSIVAAVLGVSGFLIRIPRATLTERPRFQWPAWGATVSVAIAIGASVLNALVDWPPPILAIAVGATLLVPLSFAIAAAGDVPVRIDRMLVHTITLAGLAGLVGASYLLVVLGLGRAPEDDERSILGLSILAAALAALLWVPARERLTEFATRRVYGERHAPDEIIRTFGSRLTRALPLDELLLQLAESLKKTMTLEVAEVWTKAPTGGLERAVSVPDRGPASVVLSPEEEPVVARAGVSGPAWARVWLPAVVPKDVDEPLVRVAPVTNSGELLGLLVVERPEGATAFDEDDDQALTDLARQVGLALHNVRLDSALQESLEEVQRQADQLRASRARIVQAGDEQRRAIERNLHDGAQQHLVALAVSVRLASRVSESDPEQARTMLDQIGEDLQEAVQELRALAHGIYPPLLAERGLREALVAAANRAALPTSVVAEDIDRYPQTLEAAVYFCVLEALQNAGKHAGEGSQATITLTEEEGALLFEVADDGAGFDMSTDAHLGVGFVNMTDRVGAIGGTLKVDSAPGRGTKIAGRIPLGE